MSILAKIFGDANEKYINKIRPLVDKINSLEDSLTGLSDVQLKQKTLDFKERLAQGATLDDLLPEAFAVVREATKRTLGQRQFDSQMLGAIGLHQGRVVEMRTGEGKTLTATLSVYLNALEGKGVHVVTVNDYLSRRDCVWMGQIYNFLGLSVSCLNHEQSFLYDPLFTKVPEEKEQMRDDMGSFYVVEDFLKPCKRQEAYNADIVYGTNNEFGFDYLRDNMIYSVGESIKFDFNYAVVDEIDSILIDEARTPLIISGVMDEAVENYHNFSLIVDQLKKDIDYELDEKTRSIKFIQGGEQKVVNILGKDPWAEVDLKTVHRLENALKAKEFYLLDREYVVKGNEIIIVDEFTGRLMPGRRWSDGLHQAVEAKEHTHGNPGVEVKPESITLATVTFQNLFRKYKKLAGMTGTASSSAEEFSKVYNLDVVVVPTNKPMIRKDGADKVYKNEKAKYRAIVQDIAAKHKAGQPVLVGTRSIEKNEYLSKLLQIEGVPHQVLNAKKHEQEAQIIAQAGKTGAVTIATNMAGRGVDIILGGNPPSIGESEQVRNAGGLCVIGTERHEARRIDDQLRGRAGRQGDPGFSQFFVSLEDDLMRIFGGQQIKAMMEGMNFPEDEPIEHRLINSAIESAQKRVEGSYFDTRKYLLEYDDVMNKHREVFYKKRRELLEMPKDELEKKYHELIGQYGYSDQDFSKKKEEIGPERFELLMRFAYLKILDTLWIEHLESMGYLKESVGIRAYGHLDPLVEYKNEGYKMFQRLLAAIDQMAIEAFFNMQTKADVVKEEKTRMVKETGENKPGRNDKCPCGSGKKYKSCCWPKYD